jgi:hypothetical protein
MLLTSSLPNATSVLNDKAAQPAEIAQQQFWIQVSHNGGNKDLFSFTLGGLRRTDSLKSWTKHKVS